MGVGINLRKQVEVFGREVYKCLSAPLRQSESTGKYSELIK